MMGLRDAIAAVEPLSVPAMEAARKRLDALTKPRGSLGRLEEIAERVAGITGNPIPRIRRKVVFTLAADHGVASEGVSAYPREVTAQMVSNFLAGGAAINVLCRYVGAVVVVADFGVAAEIPPNPALMPRRIGPGTRNMAREPAMTRDQAVQAVVAGIGLAGEAVADMVATGDMGIGNTTAASAIVSVITGRPAEEVTGRGTGVDDLTLQRKIGIIRKAVARNRPDPADGIDVLAKVGGFEIGGLAGIILGAAARRVPIVIDGFISGAAALIAVTLCPRARDYLIAGHRSPEPGHGTCLEWLGLTPVLDLGMRLGEGTGAALAMVLVEGACRILGEMATFEEAKVSRKDP